MNTRSIRFRLTVWYAGLLTTLLALFGVFIYFMLERFQERSLTDTLAKDAQTVGQSWLFDIGQSGAGYVAAEIEEHFAPSIIGRFVRLTREDGSVVYHLAAPESGAFDPSHVGPRRFEATQSSREEHLPGGGKELLIFSLLTTDRAGHQYVIETGAPYDQVDRVACPWLIRRFIDSDAQFLFVTETELLEVAAREGAIPFDVPRLSTVKLNHRGERCTFESIIEDYSLNEPGLSSLALIVRAADINGQEHVALEAWGLHAVAEGCRAMGLSDEDRLTKQFPLYDALLAYCRKATR
jgi:hypothetical protein